MTCICQVGHCDDACEICADLHPTEPCPYDDGFAAHRPETCVYETSLDKPCGREATIGEHCDFHSVTAQLDSLDWRADEIVITVPPSVRPLVDRILSDFTVNLETRPWEMNR